MPTPSKQQLKLVEDDYIASNSDLDLYEALKFVQSGHRIRRTIWRGKPYFALMDGDQLCIKLDDGLYHAWVISTDDLNAQDWEVIAADE